MKFLRILLPTWIIAILSDYYIDDWYSIYNGYLEVSLGTNHFPIGASTHQPHLSPSSKAWSLPSTSSVPKLRNWCLPTCCWQRWKTAVMEGQVEGKKKVNFFIWGKWAYLDLVVSFSLWSSFRGEMFGKLNFWWSSLVEYWLFEYVHG